MILGPRVKIEKLPVYAGRGRRGASKVSVTLFIQHLLLSDPYREMRIDFGRDYSYLELIVVSKKKSNKTKTKTQTACVCVREKQADNKTRTACFRIFLSQYSDILKVRNIFTFFKLIILPF